MSGLGPTARRSADAFARRDPFWPAQVTVAAAIALSLDLPSTLTIRQVWLIPSIEGVLLAALVLSTPWVPAHHHHHRRRVALGLVGLVSASNLVNLGLLVHVLLHGHVQSLLHGQATASSPGSELVLAGVEIWVTNVLLFTVLYWELDRGGPLARRGDELRPPDFLFPQMTERTLGGMQWCAGYVDYLYTSFTNATAFSPTDTMPLSPPAKLMMLVQSGASLVTLGMVLARAVNILTG
ncbi:MAG TPA: hypothetical protein VN740_06380 [Solirubrobacteraceae bacterium]|nr:hypothetical protein [Solirubrobacteraceae bacterium]